MDCLLRLVARAVVALFVAVVAYAPARAQQSDATTLDRLRSQMLQHYDAGRYAEALPQAEQLAELVAEQSGRESKEYGVALFQVGNVLGNLQRFADAEARLRQARAILAHDPGNRTELLGVEVVLASNLVFQNKLEEGVALMRASAEELAERLGPGNSRSVTALNNLASTLQMTGRPQEAEAILRRLIGAVDPTLPANYYALGNLHGNLASMLKQTNRSAEGLKEMRQSVDFFRKIGNRDHAYLAAALNNLAYLEADAGNQRAAEDLYREALEIIARSLGRVSQAYATAQSNLAVWLSDAGRTQEAEALITEAVAIFERTLGPDHPKTGSALNTLAVLMSARGDWSGALQNYRRTATIAIQSAKLVGLEEGRTLDPTFGLNAADFPSYVRAIFHIDPNDPALQEEAFLAVQRQLTSRTAAAISRMAARTVAPDSALGETVRREQDLLRQRVEVDKSLVAALGVAASETARAQLRSELTRIDRSLADIAATLKERFPQYAALASDEPIGLREFQSTLHSDEAFVTFIEAEGNGILHGESFVWVVTRDSVVWRQLEIGERRIGAHVPALRCGLDAEMWRRPETAAVCEQNVGAAFTAADAASGQPLPYNLFRAHELYRDLLGKVEASLRMPDGRWRQLLVVATGDLAVLPLTTLLTELPTVEVAASVDDYVNVKWLGVRQPITMLPSIGSLKALRLLAKTSRGNQAFIGFGNPLLDGRKGVDDVFAAAARVRASCATAASPKVASAARSPRATALMLQSGGHADADLVRTTFAPLPETADELCAVAQFLGAPPEAVHLGNEATESRVKALSASGELAQARIVHFATHGLLASEAQIAGARSREPALVLTPPTVGSETDDGLLTSTEIAGLKLDADWVVLSACNTAAGEAGGLEAFSGLARAFFYAGARTLLVSHWQVDSQATVELVTKVFGEMTANKGQISRAEAHRRAMADLVARGGRLAHPASWAPFVVVGEGGAVR